jgi:hypothetical protein
LIIRGFDEGSTDSFFSQAAVYDMVIHHPISERLIGVEREYFVDENYYYVAVQKDDWRRTAFKTINRSVFGIKGDEEISANDNYLFVCVNANEWGSIPLSVSSKPTIGNENIGEHFLESHFVHIFTNSGWRKFAVTTVDFDIIDLDLSYRLASKLTFDIDGAQLKSQSYSQTLGDNMSVSAEFTFAIGRLDGMKMYLE